MTRRVVQVLDDWQGEPARPGIAPERPGVLQRLATIEDLQRSGGKRMDVFDQRLAAVEAQLRPNGGQSFRDAVDKAIRPPTVEAGGMGFQVERSYADDPGATVRHR